MSVADEVGLDGALENRRIAEMRRRVCEHKARLNRLIVQGLPTQVMEDSLREMEAGLRASPGAQERPFVSPGAQERPIVGPGAQERPIVGPGAQERPIVGPGAQERPIVQRTGRPPPSRSFR